MNFHIDYGGAAFWYHLLNGQKEFVLIECTDKSLNLYELFVDARKNKDKIEFFADTVSDHYPETIYHITLRAGQTLVVPMGYIHAVYTPLDSIAFVGSFFYDSGASQSLTIHNEIECFDKENYVTPFFP
jgi:F-box/leucine-rich repeat protein 10/11